MPITNSRGHVLPRIDSKGRVTIPAKIRAALKLQPGDRIDFLEMEKGRFDFVPITRSVLELKGMFGKRAKAISIKEMSPLSSRTRRKRR
jgi:antitoxin PrlF